MGKATAQPWDIVERHADRPYLSDAVHGRTYSYGAFGERARALADELEGRGLQAGGRLGILLPNCPEFAALYFACLALGAVAVPINIAAHSSEIALLLERCGARLVACSTRTAALVASSAGGSLEPFPIAPWGGTADDGWALAGRHVREPLPCRAVDEREALSITFTSGTTGLPKGIVHARSSLFNAAAAFADALAYDPDTCLLHLFSMAYMAGFLNTLLCPFVAGASVVIGGGFTPSSATHFWDEPIRHGVNTLWTSPTMLAALMSVDRQRAGPAYAKRALRAVSVGTAPYPPVLRERFEARYGVATYESYGLSETLFVSTDRPGRTTGGVGPALPGVELRLTGGDADGSNAELGIRSQYLMLGQLDVATGRIDAPVSEWFASGDLAHLDGAAGLHIDGRAKDLIIRGGTNISPRAVEDCLERHVGVEAAAVVGVPHDFYGEEVVAVLRLRDGFAPAGVRAELLLACRQGLAAHAVPARFLFLDDFPRSSTGKIQKAKLRELAAVPA